MNSSETDFPTQPPMLSFKHFLATQDDNITDAESIQKYNKYKLDFKKEQIKEFFAQHKDEEWYVFLNTSFHVFIQINFSNNLINLFSNYLKL